MKQIMQSAVMLLVFSLTLGPTHGDDDLSQRAAWSVPQASDVRAALEGWLIARNIELPTRQQIEAVWVGQELAITGQDLLDRFVQSAALVDPDAKVLLDLTRGDSVVAAIPPLPILDSESTPAFVRANLRLHLGCWFAQRSLFDEALQQLSGLSTSEVVDPASLLFYRSVANHQLFKKQECEPDLDQLLKNEELVPRRFHTIARLLQADMQTLKPDSLDEVARMMSDIRRRLDLGRAGKVVRKEEDDVIAKLDKMIEEMEEQQKQQLQQLAANAGSAAPNSPRNDSQPGGVRGPGDVAPKNIGNQSGWGNLPPKERQEALQNISKDLPSHFRDAIEEYFRKMAHDGVKK